MSTSLTHLNATAFTLAGQSYYGLLTSAESRGDNDIVESKALSRYSVGQAVKQSDVFNFSIQRSGDGSGPKSGNLDVSAWSIGGTDYVASLRSGSISAVTKVVEGSGMGSAYKLPVPVGTDVTVSCDLLIPTSADLVAALLNGTYADFLVDLAFTYDTETFAVPAIIKSAGHTVKRDEMQMQNVEFALAGTPTEPASAATSMLGEILLGSGVVALSFTSGAGTYSAADCVLSKLDIKFADGAVTEMTGELMAQGALAVA